MALRIFTRGNENLLIKEEILENVRRENSFIYSFPLWKLDSQDRLTLAKPRFADKAYFRITAYPGCGMVAFDLEAPDDSCLKGDIYYEYHESMMEYICRYFQNRFYLMERTPFEQSAPLRDATTATRRQ